MARENPGTGSITRLDLQGTAKKRQVRIQGTFDNQFGIPGTWLRGTLHCHLARPGNHDWTNGAIDHYRRFGYDFIGGMDHDKIVPLASASDLLVIPGAELSTPGHLLAHGIDTLPTFAKDGDRIEGTVNAVQAVKAMGGMTTLAHPFKSGYTWEQLKRLCAAGLDGIEIVNSDVRGKGSDTGRADQLWHNLMREGCLLRALGNDDAHGFHEDPAASAWEGIPHIAWTGVLAEDFSVEGVLDAIRSFRTYASEGPEFHSIVCHADGQLVVECSPCAACHFRSVGGGWGGGSAFPAKTEGTGQRFVFDFTTTGYRVSDYMVIVLQDVHGRRAWTSPIPVDLTLTDIG